MSRRSRPVAAFAVLAFILLLPGAASAVTPTPGSWTGTSGVNDLTFTVGSGGKTITDFTVPAYPVYCFTGGSGNGMVTTRVLTVPSIVVDANGKFDSAKQPTDPKAYGSAAGSFTAPNTVSGTLNYNVDGCYGGASFEAATKAVPGPPKVSFSRPPKTIKLAKLFTQGLRITITTDALVGAGVVLDVEAPTARTLKLGKKQTDLGQVTGTVTTSKTFTVRPKAKFRSKLAKAKHFTLFMDVDLEDANNHTITRSYKIGVSR